MSVCDSSDVSPSASIAPSAHIWHLAQVREGAVIGDGVVIGRAAYIGPAVTVGARSKIQNLAQIFEPAVIGEGVFIGPGVILTNDRNPRAINPDMTQKRPEDWVSVGVVIGDGAAIGAGAICVAPIQIGRWSMVGAGAVVLKDVPDYALVVGSPSRQVGWVGRLGVRLEVVGDARSWRCPVTGDSYQMNASGELFLQED